MRRKVQLRLHPVDLAGIEQAAHVRVEPEAGRAARRVVAPRALRTRRCRSGRRARRCESWRPPSRRASRSSRSCRCRERPCKYSSRDEILAQRTGPPHGSNRETGRRLATASRSQNGQRSVRACSGLRHCQQNRAAGASRARSRVWMLCASSRRAARPADSGRPRAAAAGVRRGCVAVRAASTSSSRSEARW